MTRHILPSLMALVLAATACKQGQQVSQVRADGSSTVFPITEAVAEAWHKARNSAQVTVAVSGTGGGFKRLCNHEADLVGASRPIKQAEVDLCAKNKVDYVELPVAYDGLSVVVNPRNTWATSITVAELKRMWEPAAQGKIRTWKDVREDWPDTPLVLFGPGVDSGTYDYFTEAVVGKEHSSRGDFTSSEDDNVLVQGVSREPGALGFFGYGYYVENRDKLRLLPVDDGVADNGAGPIAPSEETVRNGTYRPLSRPLFVYAARSSLDRPEVTRFVEFYLGTAPGLLGSIGYVPLTDQANALTRERARTRVTGSMFAGKAKQTGVTLEAMLQQHGQGAR
ncbi:MAG: PstS family phosphate ABC transporter substrate-binding protein [Myxococcota bacterium]